MRIVDRFRDNWREFWGQYWLVAAVFFVALACDGASTVYFMLQTGPDTELHPGVKFVSQIIGPVAGPILGVIGKGVAGVIVAVYLRRFAVYIFFTGAFLSFWAAWYNVWGHETYVPLFMRWFLF